MARWDDLPAPETGRLEEPTFVRGFDPLTAPHWQRPRLNPWRRHFDLGRQNPAVWNPATREYDGGWMLVSEIRKGGCRARLAAIKRDRAALVRIANRENPLERWQLRIVTVLGTYCDRELYMRYLGVLTPEEDKADRRRRQELYLAKQAQQRENRERRAAAARKKALEEEAAAKVAIRARRKPGQ